MLGTTLGVLSSIIEAQSPVSCVFTSLKYGFDMYDGDIALTNTQLRQYFGNMSKTCGVWLHIVFMLICCGRHWLRGLVECG
jgi:hypothetical protein